LSVLWLHIVTCEACVLCTAHTPHRSQHNTDNESYRFKVGGRGQD